MKTKEIYGPLFFVSSPSAGLQSSLANKLMARFPTGGSTEYAMTWRELVTPSGRPYCQLAVSVRHTSGSDSSGVLSGWTTPQASEPDSPERPSRVATGRTTEYLGRQVNQLAGWPSPTSTERSGQGERNVSLLQDAKLAGWPSPVTEEHRNTRANGNTKAGETLDHAAKLTGWPTPRSEDSEFTGAHRGTPDTLNSASKLAGWGTPTDQDAKHSSLSPSEQKRDPNVLRNQVYIAGWATPTRKDDKDGASDLSNVPINSLLGRQVTLSTAKTDATEGSRLNPAFSLWLIAGDSVTPVLIETCPRGLVPSGQPGTR
jgi:hypothetical protein